MGKRNTSALIHSDKQSSSSSKSQSPINTQLQFRTGRVQTSPDHIGELTKEQRDQQRRRRNVQSAKRSRERKREKDRLMELQMHAIQDRIKYLEAEASTLQAELNRPPRVKPNQVISPGRSIVAPHTGQTQRGGTINQSCGERPSWFGTPF